ncbi:MAG: tRNA (N(6)-L-threonylcarbamoyladenosine(37)-C(2))-methylthiotransferase MtaB [Patescibacteria group bacterium]
MKIFIKTIGCRLNQAESQTIADELQQIGFFIVDEKENPDLIIVNTCAVTEKADKESKQIIRSLKNKNPKAKIVMIGCCRFKLDEIDMFIEDKDKVVDVIRDNWGCGAPQLSHKNISGRTRTNIKIQDGCNNKCTYCITTLRRGKSKSIPINNIIDDIKEREKQGYKEIVITGVNIGEYLCKYKEGENVNEGEDGDLRLQHKSITLINLLQEILNQTKIERIRLSSINPDYVYHNHEFIDLFNDPRMCRHLHLSLQSGSNQILEKMKRHYTREQYLEITETFYKAYPGFGFTTDVIVGFPGETDEDFNDTLDLVQNCKFLKLHIFRYSKRPDTKAATMPDQIDENIKVERAKKLEQVNQKLKKQFQDNMVGKEIEVLIEGERDGYWLGTAGNFMKIKIESNKDLKNKIIKLKI